VLTVNCQVLQVFLHQRALTQAANGGDSVYGPLVHPITDASSLTNISGIWVGIGEQFDAGRCHLHCNGCAKLVCRRPCWMPR
jgi:hypothetical protein